MQDSHPDKSDKARSRARSAKIPATLTNPDGSITHLSKKQRGIIRRIPTADKFRDISDEMKCSNTTVSKTYHLPAVQQYLREQMEAAGITHGLLMERLREGLDATKEDRAGGERTDFGERREHIKLALRLQGMDTAPDKEDAAATTPQSIYNIVINARINRGLAPKEAKIEGETND